MNENVIRELTKAMRSVAEAVTADAQPGHDAHGIVASLTEAVIGVSSALDDIASSIDRVADAISAHATETLVQGQEIGGVANAIRTLGDVIADKDFT